ncbi:MAG TPA: PIG-L family deacetylase [Actinocrinis sp.]|nr:PIG-L family deacetylase [Actinocrinis sp.]
MAAAPKNRNTDPAMPGVVQIVAHPDDDLYFLNPDLSADLARGIPVVSVCVTCGETDGKNAPPDEPGFGDLPVDFAGYSGARQMGLMHAYARMAGVPAQSAWRREVVQLVPGIAAERVVLVARPQVELIFLNLWQDASRSPEGMPGRPRQLWSGEIARIPTLPPTGSAAADPASYTREQLIDALHAVLMQYRPTTVRIMDPDPDYQNHDANHRRHADYGDYSDHQDHTAIALFATAAIQRYGAGGAPRPFSVVAYRGYYNERWPHNLTAAAYAEKADYLAVYGWADGHTCANDSGCGDRKVGDMAPGTHWGQSMTYRNPPSLQNALLGEDGRLRFFAALGGRAAVWTQLEPGADAWSGPDYLPGGDLAPELAAVADASGRVLLFAIETTLGETPAGHRRNLVVAAQQEPGGTFGPWESLGNPHDGDNPWRLRGVGVPAAVCRGDGAVQVFLRNYGTGVSSRLRERDGRWGPWLDLGGSDTQDGLSAVVLADGRVELAAATRRGVLRWFQQSPSGEFSRELLRTQIPVGPPTLIASPDGGARLLLRRSGGADVVMYAKPGPEADWELSAQIVGGAGGVGPVAAACGRGLLAAVKRGDDGRAAALVIDLDAPASPVRWKGLGLEPVTCPVVTIDAAGPLAIAVGLDGALHTARLSSASGRGVGAIDRLASARRSVRASARDFSRRLAAPRHKWKPAEIDGPPIALDARPASHVQIVAHPDDDLYFMNPDLLNAIRAGDRITTVVLCAGEADGVNGPASGDRRQQPDFEGYAAARATGLRRAYAAMATSDPDSPWERREEKLGDGILVEVAQLNARPEVTLVYFNLRILGAPRYRPALRMRNLWNGSVDAMQTLVPTDSPVSTACAVTRTALVAALAQLLDRARPTTVRILDPDPECLDFSPEGETTFKDHLDHTMSAYFSLEALRRHRGASAAQRPVAVESYRGYLNRELPHGLAPAEWAQKKNYLDLYGAADRPRGVSGKAVGDRKVADRADQAGYGFSTSLRHSASAPWAMIDDSGTAHAFAVVDGEIRHWSAAGGGNWRLTDTSPSDAHWSELTVAAGPHAIHVVASRMEIVARYDSQTRELFTASKAPDERGASEELTRLQGPHDSDHPVKRHGLGAPALVAESDGGLRLFVRNFGTGLSAAHRDSAGKWGDWQDLRGFGLTGPLSVARSSTGRIHVVGATTTGFIHWIGQEGEADYEQSRVLGNLPAAPVGPPTLVVLDDGQVALLSRVSGSGTVLCWNYEDGSGWAVEPRDLDVPGGHGAIAALWNSGSIYVATRNRGGSVSTGRFDETANGPVVWRPSGGLVVQSPALVAVDTRPTLVTLGSDARLYSAKLEADGSAGALSAADE